ncbi:unnamed protein product [Toxocara canis]|uniref:Uncharacterized protein n=1 Tax=Toxocara canis TaxID=6265 RepID=A0A183V5G8_TOXCA|nr:unnamed protein product [Toxocara canis]
MYDEHDSHEDEDLRRAIELSRQSYEEELRRREQQEQAIVDALSPSNECLIEFQDTDRQQRRQQQIDEITRLYGEMPPPHTANPFAQSVLRMPSTSAAEWCTIRFPRAQQQRTEAPPPIPSMRPVAVKSNTHLIGANTFGAFPQLPAFYASSSKDGAQQSDSSPQVTTSSTNSNSVSTITDASVIVPFRPLTTRLLNGDLIDLGRETEPDVGTALTYEQICDEFDPLCARNRASRANSIALPQSRSSGVLETKTSLEVNSSQPTLERSQSINSTHSQLTSKPGWCSCWLSHDLE